MKLGFGKLAPWVLVCLAMSVGVASAQTVAPIVSFNGSNGANPHASLIQAQDGYMYGTTYYGGASNYGTIFKVSNQGAYTLLHTFTNTDGARPWSGLVQATDGNFYGTTSLGGTLGGGTVFKITSSGTLTTLFNFGGNGGTIPYGGLLLATDGNFYGTTYSGGTNGKGTVFKIANGVLTTIYNFAGTDGAGPYATLIQGTDGNLYGTTYQGGTSNEGTVYVITTAGSLTTLYSFGGGDGIQPYASLVQGTDGNFYGTTQLGGTYNNGTVFQITSTGSLTTLHNFCSPTNCDDGSILYGGLVQAADGSFYGAASAGGHYAGGTIYNITTAGVVTTAHAFNSAEGKNPYSSLIIGSSGNLYGTTYKGGSANDGTVYSLAPTPYQFTSVVPCRLVDTRQTGPISGGTYQTFDLKQLSQNNGCGDISAADLYSLNVTLIPVSGHPVGYLTIWPTGESQPTISTMNSSDGRIKANAAIVPGGTDGEVNVFVTDTANVVLDINAYFGPKTASTLAFYAVPPCRLVDTRGSNGPLGGPFLAGGQERDFPLLSGNCTLPLNAQAYSLNITAVPYNNQPLGYLTVWPTGQAQPHVSTLNNSTHTVVANAAMVVAGTNGSIAVYPSDNTQLVIDVNGYFATNGSGGLSLYPALPCRAFDTRAIGSGQPFSGTLTPSANVVASPCAIPSAAQAFVFNATVVPSPTLGYLTLWADGQIRPTVSTLNATDGLVTSNMAVVPNADGKTAAYAQGTTQLILDISSYFAP